MTTAQQVLETARGELGFQESPPDSNRTKYGKWYGLDGNPWCMMFVMWVFDQAGGAALLPMRTASCGEFVQAAEKAGNWRTENYQPGDVVVFDFPHTGAFTDHTGIVEAAGDGYLVTIEGNTGERSESNGGMVMRRQRSLSVVLGGFRPAYERSEETEFPAVPEEESRLSADPDAAEDTEQAEDGEPELPEDAIAGAGLLTVTASPSLPVRCGPGEDYVSVAALAEGAVISVDRNLNGWGHLQDGGWIDLQFTEHTE